MVNSAESDNDQEKIIEQYKNEIQQKDEIIKTLETDNNQIEEK
jgi:hypothetical protein